MGARTRLALVLLAVASIALAQQTPAPSGGTFEWRVQLKQNTTAPSTIEAINRCKKTHRFQVDPARLPFMRVLGPTEFTVKPKSSFQAPVEFDTRNLQPGQYEALIVVKCLTCRTELTCTEDHENLRVFLTVLSSAPDWSSVDPGQKPQSPRTSQSWPGVSPAQKPPKR